MSRSVQSTAWPGAGGNLVFTDSTHDLTRRMRPDGIIETMAGTGITGSAVSSTPALPDLITIRSMAFDSQDRLWVSTGATLYVIAPDGSITVKALGAALAIAFYAKSGLYLMNTYSLDRVSPDGSARRRTSV